MQIIYIWVREFRNLTNFELNLSDDMNIKYSCHDKLIGFNADDFANDIPKELFSANIKSINAIIGRNGSGKTNVIELICNIVKTKKINSDFDYFYVYRIDNNVYFESNKNDNELNVGFDCQRAPESLNKDLKVIFYSNVFADRDRGFPAEVIDQSPDSLRKARSYAGDITGQFKIQRRFIERFSNLIRDISAPPRIAITVNNFHNDIVISKNFGNNFKKNISLIRKRIKDLSSKNKFLYSLKLSIILRSLIISVRLKVLKEADVLRFSSKVNELFFNFSNVKTHDLLEEIIDEVRNYLDQHPNDNDREISKLKSLINLSMQVDDYLQNVEFSELVDSLVKVTDRTFVVDNDINSKKFIDKIFKDLGDDIVVSINWLGISSGQRALLNIFSLIVASIEKGGSKNCLVCIDEGDLYLHPKWQMEFFNNLLGILSSFVDCKFQIVLTSHSPFIMSDIPAQKITILNGLNDKKTFAADLYQLYSGPFMIADEKISLFAKNRILHFKNKFNNKEIDAVEYKKFCNLIGDEILKSLLLQSINNKVVKEAV